MARMKSLKILVEMAFPEQTVRLHDGAGPFIDLDGNIWLGANLPDTLDVIEGAMNGEAYTLTLGIRAVGSRALDLAYEEINGGDVIGSTTRIMIQGLDKFDIPVGEPDVVFTGTIDNDLYEEAATNGAILASLMVEIVNRFTLRMMQSGAVLSDVDQRARSAVLNPGALADRACERVPDLADKVLSWPRAT